jgi:hypothetical protein
MRIVERTPALGGWLAMMGAAMALSAPAYGAECGFAHAFTRTDEGGATSVRVFEGQPIPALGGVRPLLFLSDLKINTDGALISYNENDPTGRKCATDPAAQNCAVNNIRNAYRNHNNPVSDFVAIRDAGYSNLDQVWSVLSDQIIEKDAETGKPCITEEGYLVSMTADVAVAGGFNRVGDCDQSKWIDALTMPAIVLPGHTTASPSQFRQRGANLRSAVIVMSPGPDHRVVAGIVGDSGPVREIGEANIAMNRKLNGLAEDDNPKHRQDAINRFQVRRSAILVLPGTSMMLPRPITGDSIVAKGDEVMAALGGEDGLLACIHEVDDDF